MKRAHWVSIGFLIGTVLLVLAEQHGYIGMNGAVLIFVVMMAACASIADS